MVVGCKKSVSSGVFQSELAIRREWVIKFDSFVCGSSFFFFPGRAVPAVYRGY
jgi:hypothetical protein